MARIRHPHDDTLGYLQNLPILAGAQQSDSGGSVVGVIHRQHRRLTGTLRFSGLPLGFGLLNVGGIHEHNPAQVAGCLGGVDGAGEAVLAQLRQHTGVVDVGMGQEHRLNIGGLYRQGDILENIRPLLHTAVHQIVTGANFQQRAAASDFVGSADELDLHTPHLQFLLDGLSAYTIPPFPQRDKVSPPPHPLSAPVKNGLPAGSAGTRCPCRWRKSPGAYSSGPGSWLR